MLYIILRGHWCDIFPNVHAPTKYKSEDTKESFYEELECVCNPFPKYHTTSLLDFSAKIGRRYFQTNNLE
jgi:hypothetical protein